MKTKTVCKYCVKCKSRTVNIVKIYDTYIPLCNYCLRKNYDEVAINMVRT